MNNNEKPAFLRGKGAAVSLVICFAAVIVLVGAYTFSNYRNDMEEQAAKAEEQAEEFTEEISEWEMAAEDPAEEAAADEIVLPETESTQTADEDAVDGTGTEGDTGENGDISGDGTTAPEDASGTSEDSPGISEVWFTEDSTLAWPASGPVVMSYSMDQTVFFQTLEQYQYNPAMMVSGEVGEIIGASAPGIVTDIEELAETGTTVTLDMGNGYTAVYGQLTDVPLAVGDYVDTGEAVGTLAEPTKYFSIEGPNLYFEVTKDGEPVDPLNYME